MATAPGQHHHMRIIRARQGQQPPPSRVSRPLLWFGVLGGPVAFGAVRLAEVIIVSGQCFHPAGSTTLFGLSSSQQLLAAITIVCALVAAAAGIVSWQIWHATRRREEEQTSGTMRTVPFWALGGLFLSGLFCAIIILTGGLALGLSTSCAS